jgi:CRP-like cAMP-binding protein
MSFFSKVFYKTEKNTQQPNHNLSDDYQNLVHTLIPFNELTEVGFAKAMNIASFREIPEGETLFNLGDKDKKTIYLLEGSVELNSQDNKTKLITSKQVSSFYPLSNLKPRRFIAKATSPVVVVEFPSDELERLIHWDQVTAMESMGDIEVEEGIKEGSDLSWVFHLTSSPSIAQFPAANIASLFNAFKPIDVSAGQVIIRQGEVGDCYYVIAKGKCDVLVKNEDGQLEKVNSLGEGQTFGEEALISNLPRNATIRMTSDGVLMGLAKKDFSHLLKEKILKWVLACEIPNESYVYLDVRSESEFRHDGLQDSIHLPLQDLRLKCESLDKKKKYLAYCDNGSRSSSAAYLLADRGFDVSILKGGLAGFSEVESNASLNKNHGLNIRDD